MQKTYSFPVLCLSAALLSLIISCSKGNDPSSGGPSNNSSNYGMGNIYIKQGTEGITKFNMVNGTLSDIMPDWTDAGWDISWDGTKGVKEVGPTSFGTVTHYIIFKTADGSTIKDVAYEGNTGYDGGLPNISPDGTKLALRPTFDEGLVILDINTGNMLHNISGYGSTHEFEYLDPVTWEAGSTVLFQKDGGLWRTSTDFSHATKVRDIPFSDWHGNVAASPDGKKIALGAGNHIWLMNADGSDFHAITESDQWEASPTFSPDSKYIAIKANSRAGEDLATAAHICIIPADGQVYKVWPGDDSRVIHPIVKGETRSDGLGKTIVGDFVWRE